MFIFENIEGPNGYSYLPIASFFMPLIKMETKITVFHRLCETHHKLTDYLQDDVVINTHKEFIVIAGGKAPPREVLYDYDIIVFD